MRMWSPVQPRHIPLCSAALGPGFPCPPALTPVLPAGLPACLCRVFERDGVQVVCDTVSMDFLKGAVVEFEDSLMRSAFQVGGWVVGGAEEGPDNKFPLQKQGTIGALVTLYSVAL